MVAGRTEHANETITLDGQFTMTSDRRHRFVFRVPYYPPSCTVTLRAGSDERTAAVAVCAAAGAAGSRGESGAAGPQGLQGLDGEIALNAVCTAGPAALKDEGQITCGSANAAPMIAFCAR